MTKQKQIGIINKKLTIYTDIRLNFSFGVYKELNKYSQNVTRNVFLKSVEISYLT